MSEPFSSTKFAVITGVERSGMGSDSVVRVGIGDQLSSATSDRALCVRTTSDRDGENVNATAVSVDCVMVAEDSVGCATAAPARVAIANSMSSSVMSHGTYSATEDGA